MRVLYRLVCVRSGAVPFASGGLADRRSPGRAGRPKPPHIEPVKLPGFRKGVPSLLFFPALLLAYAAPFWDTKPPSEWTLDEVMRVLTDSPWAQPAEAGAKNTASPVQVYVASADPVIQAEDRFRAAKKQQATDSAWEDYREYLIAGTDKYIVLAAAVENKAAFYDNAETKRMEEESVLKIGKRKYRVAGHFPPSAGDPFVRLVFPRDVRPEDRSLRFEVYVPGNSGPYRMAEFRLKEMTYRGRPSY